VFVFMYLWPAVERRITRDWRRHDLLERPRDNPMRTAVGAAVLTWVGLVFTAGALDRIYFRLNIPYEGQVWFWRFGAVLVPVGVFFLTRRICRDLKRGERHPLRGWYGSVVRRTPSGGYVADPVAADEPSEVPPDARVREPSGGSTLP
jgi:ubiquinol-cytochrome c reductase cytochrome b subunit